MCTNAHPLLTGSRPRVELPTNCNAHRLGVEPDHERQLGVPGPGNKAARFLHLRYRGRDAVSLDQRPHPPNNAVLAVDNSVTPNPAAGAVYKGLAVGVSAKGVFLFATNFRGGTVDVYAPAPAGSTTGLYVPATTDGGFTDPDLPSGYAPFGIQNIDGDLFVTYALQNAAKHDDTAGSGHGFVDVFDTDGHLLRRFASRGKLDSPWGVARASFAFGRFSGNILIGNFGDGKVNVFDSKGKFLDQLRDTNNDPIVIDGLWTVTLGGGAKSSPDTLYFTAGTNGETDGLFGTITPANNNN
jgi:uncharacterized protein (TIGR03118 family)